MALTLASPHPWRAGLCPEAVSLVHRRVVVVCALAGQHPAHLCPQEDAELKRLVGELGPGRWNRHAAYFNHRTPKSCRLR